MIRRWSGGEDESGVQEGQGGTGGLEIGLRELEVEVEDREEENKECCQDDRWTKSGVHCLECLHQGGYLSPRIMKRTNTRSPECFYS